MNTNRLHPVLLGHRKDGRPIWLLRGGSGQDELDVEPDDEEEDESEEEEPDAKPDKKNGKYVPPEQGEWLKVQASLSKSNASARERRIALKDAERKIAELEAAAAQREAEAERQAILDSVKQPDEPAGRKGKKTAAPATPPPVLPDGVMTKAQVRQLTAQAAREAEQRAVDKFHGKMVNSAAREALKDAGVQSANVARLVRLLELDEVQIDDEGEVTEGLEEQIESLKIEMPQLFQTPEPAKPVRKRAPAPRAQIADRPQALERPRTSAEQMASSILGERS